MQATLSFASMAVLLAGGIAIAQSPSQSPSAPKEEIKPPKYMAKFSEQFRHADRDGDGALTRAEAEAAGMGRTVDHFDHIDANQDGKVTLEEMRALIRNRITS